MSGPSQDESQRPCLSTDEHCETYEESRYNQGMLLTLFLISVLGCLFHLIFLFVILKSKTLRSKTLYCFIISVCLPAVGYFVSSQILQLLDWYKSGWDESHHSCEVHRAVDLLASSLVFYQYALVSIHQALMINYKQTFRARYKLYVCLLYLVAIAIPIATVVNPTWGRHCDDKVDRYLSIPAIVVPTIVVLVCWISVQRGVPTEVVVPHTKASVMLRRLRSHLPDALVSPEITSQEESSTSENPEGDNAPLGSRATDLGLKKQWVVFSMFAVAFTVVAITYYPLMLINQYGGRMVKQYKTIYGLNMFWRLGLCCPPALFIMYDNRISKRIMRCIYKM